MGKPLGNTVVTVIGICYRMKRKPLVTKYLMCTENTVYNALNIQVIS